jgi:hypothetical protein
MKLRYIFSLVIFCSLISCGKARPGEVDDVDEQMKRLNAIAQDHDAAKKRENGTIKSENLALENDIAELKGKPIPHPGVVHPKGLASIPPLDQSLISGLDFLQAYEACSEALVEKHNRLHPDKPWAGESSSPGPVGSRCAILDGTNGR